MARPTCPKCESSRFEMTTVDNIQNARFKMNLIHCASCGATIGVVDFQHVPTLLERIAERLGVNLR